MITSKNKRKYKEQCNECQSTDIIIHRNGETICRNCGLVLEKYVMLDNKATKSQIDRNAIEPAKDSDELISGTFTTTFNPNPYQKKMNWLRKLNHSNSKDRIHYLAIKTLNELVNHFRLTYAIKSDALYLYRKVVRNYEPIKNHQMLIAICLLQVLRQRRYPIKIRDFQAILKLYHHRSKNLLKAILNLQIKTKGLIKYKRTNPKFFIPSIISKLCNTFNIETNRQALQNKIQQILDIINYRGKQTITIIAIIYLLYRNKTEKVTQKELANLFNTNATSIRLKYIPIRKQLIKFFNILKFLVMGY